jgi:hypothetical protein
MMASSSPVADLLMDPAPLMCSLVPGTRNWYYRKSLFRVLQRVCFSMTLQTAVYSFTCIGNTLDHLSHPVAYTCFSVRTSDHQTIHVTVVILTESLRHHTGPLVSSRCIHVFQCENQRPPDNPCQRYCPELRVCDTTLGPGKRESHT